VNPRVDLDDVEKLKFFTLPGLELRPFGRPTRSKSVYRLRYCCTYVCCSRVYKEDVLRMTICPSYSLEMVLNMGLDASVDKVYD
jgi:hypothetical protein